MELSILMPCLNEDGTITECVSKALEGLKSVGVAGEVVVADNGSNDGSRELAAALGARVVCIEEKGYGAALIGGIAACKGRYIMMADADCSYDFTNVAPFLEKLRAGCELVMGNRFQGGVKPGAMPFLHRYLGNPVLSFVGRLFFRSKLGDFHCGHRAFSREAIGRLQLKCEGMEFATEMIAKAELAKLKIAEVPVCLAPDKRNRAPHLNTWRDGWRHLRFLLIYSPRWLFLYPGLIMMSLGLLGIFLLAERPLYFGEVRLDIHTLLYSSLSTTIGLQLTIYFSLIRHYGEKTGIFPKTSGINIVAKFINLELALAVGLLFLLVGIFMTGAEFLAWESAKFGDLDPTKVMRPLIIAATAITAGVEMFFAAFLVYFFSINTVDNHH